MQEKKFNWFYALIILVLVGMLIISFKFFQGSAHSSVGITYAREYKINAEKSAVINAIPVVPGQQVKAGDLLVELTSNELEIDIDKLTNRIVVLKSDQAEKSKLASSEMAFIKAQQGIEIEDLTADIARAESELTLNQNLTRQFVSKDSISKTDPMQMRINSLKKQKTRREEALGIKVKEIVQKNETEQRLIDNQIKLLQRELELYIEERKKLSKRAVSDGVIDNVYVKQGEQVDAFTSLLSIKPTYPSTVVGYMVGKKEQLLVGSDVTVRSYDGQSSTVKGRVIGYGSVVQLPDILQKSTAVKAFGREIFIEISPENGFAAGEKVLIR